MKEDGRDRQYQSISNRLATNLPVLESLMIASACGLSGQSKYRAVARQLADDRFRANYVPCERCKKRRSTLASYCQHCGALGKVAP